MTRLSSNGRSSYSIPEPNLIANQSPSIHDLVINESMMLQSVDHPPHYQGKIECIDVIDSIAGNGIWTGQRAFLIGTIVKYLYRAGMKGDTVTDLKKAQWYLNRLIDSFNEIRD